MARSPPSGSQHRVAVLSDLHRRRILDGAHGAAHIPGLVVGQGGIAQIAEGEDLVEMQMGIDERLRDQVRMRLDELTLWRPGPGRFDGVDQTVGDLDVHKIRSSTEPRFENRQRWWCGVHFSIVRTEQRTGPDD